MSKELHTISQTENAYFPEFVRLDLSVLKDKIIKAKEIVSEHGLYQVSIDDVGELDYEFQDDEGVVGIGPEWRYVTLDVTAHSAILAWRNSENMEEAFIDIPPEVLKSPSKTKHLTKVEALINETADNLRCEAKHLLDSGAIDWTMFDDDSYSLAKILMTAALNRLKDNYAPADRSYKRDVENLIKI